MQNEECVRGGSYVDTFDDIADVANTFQVSRTSDRYVLGDRVDYDDFENGSISSYWSRTGNSNGINGVSTSLSQGGSQGWYLYGYGSGASWNQGYDHTFSSLQTGNVSIYLYDNMSSEACQFRINNGGTSQFIALVAHTDWSNSYRYIYTGSSYINTGISRSVGWHKFEFRVDATGAQGYIDSTAINFNYNGMKALDRASWRNGWQTPGITTWDTYQFDTMATFGSLNTTSIPLAPGYGWDTVHIGSNCPTGTNVKLTVRDGGTNNPIGGLTNVVVSSTEEVSIAGISATSIALEFHLSTGTSGTTPSVNFWGVSYNESSSWRDTLFGGKKLWLLPGSFKNPGGEIQKTGDFGMNELIQSTTIDIPKGYRPMTLNVEKTDSSSGRIYVTVLDGVTAQPIPGYSDLLGTDIDLESINPENHTSLELRARFDASASAIPILHDWSVHWEPYQSPVIGELPAIELEEDTLIEYALDFAQYTTDDDHDARDLIYELSDITWGGAVGITLVDDHYLRVDATVTPNWNSNTFGPITGKVTAREDDFIVSDPQTFTIYVNPVNDDAYVDVLMPDIVMYEDEEDRSILLDSETYFRDAEFDKLHYAVDVDPGEVWQGEEGLLNVHIDSLVNTLVIEAEGDFNTEDKDPVVVRVSAGDDAEADDAFQDINVTVLNVNDPPVWSPLPVISLTEDMDGANIMFLGGYVSDVDDEPEELTFRISSNTNERIPVTVTEDGHISVLPEQNMWGDTVAEVVVSDGSESAETRLTVEVKPVNDIPIVQIITPSDGDILQGEYSITGSAADVENTIEYVEVRVEPFIDGDGGGRTRAGTETSIVKAVGTTSWSLLWDTVPLENGRWSISARANDGFAFSEEFSITVTLDNPRNKPPAVVISSHTGGEHVIGEFVIAGASSDPEGAVELVQISLGNNNSWQNCLPDPNTDSYSQWTFALNSTAYAGQNLTLYVRCFDEKMYSPEVALVLVVDILADGGDIPDGEDGEDGTDGGGTTPPKSSDSSTSSMGIIAIVAVIIIVVVAVLAFIIAGKRRRERERQELMELEEQALKADIIAPGGVVRRRATPVAGAGGGPMPLGGIAHGAMDVGALAPQPGAPPAVAPPGSALGAGAAVTPDLLLPKAGGTTRPAPAGPKPTVPPAPAAGAPTHIAPTVVRPAIKTTKPVDIPYKQPDAAPFMASPAVGSPTKAEVYHQDSGALWTPDMGESRAAKEAEGAVEMLAKLNKLKEAGAINDEEFESSKKRLLRKI